MKAIRKIFAATLLLVLLTPFALHANHDADCTISGGTNGPAQLDCTLPTIFVAVNGATGSSVFRYTATTDKGMPYPCAVGTLTPVSAPAWLSIDTMVLDAQSPVGFQDVTVTADPTGLAIGTYNGTVDIALTVGAAAPQCPSAGDTTGTVSVQMVVVSSIPTLSTTGLLLTVLLLAGTASILLRRV